jgi:hypothetical protein
MPATQIDLKLLKGGYCTLVIQIEVIELQFEFF